MAKIPQYELRGETLDLAVKDFETHGCLQIGNFLPPYQVDSLRERFVRDYEDCLEGRAFVKVGHQRRMVPIAIEKEFNAPSLYAAPRVLGLLERLLGERFVLGSATCITALPGARAQHLHRDYPGLFHNALDYFGPSYAVSLFVPLVALNQLHGTTRVLPGTHRKPVAAEDAPRDDLIDLEVLPGSALLMDYRVLHHGSENRSDRSRPVLCLAYCRSWFIDTVNFPNHNPLNISRTEYDKLDEPHQSLFSRARARFER